MEFQFIIFIVRKLSKEFQYAIDTSKMDLDTKLKTLWNLNNYESVVNIKTDDDTNNIIVKDFLSVV